MTVDLAMFEDFLVAHPFQPATAFWRSVEVAEVARHSLPLGRGLDLGCGDGKLTAILLERIGARDLVGIDIDPLETKQAAAFPFYKQIHTCAGDSIPEASESFDFAFSNSVLEHIDPIEPVVREIARLIRGGGRFIFTVPSAEFHTCLRGSFLPWTSRSRYLQELDLRCAHRYYLDEAGWAGLLARCGFRLKSARRYLSAVEVQRWETISRFTGGILFNLFGKKTHPIEIQRALSLRGGHTRLPRSMARSLARILTVGTASTSSNAGCLLIEAVRVP